MDIQGLEIKTKLNEIWRIGKTKSIRPMERKKKGNDDKLAEGRIEGEDTEQSGTK